MVNFKELFYTMGRLKSLFEKYIFKVGTYYIYERRLAEDTDVIPLPKGFLLKIERFGDLAHFKVFHEKELVHITSTAFVEEGKRGVDLVPYKVDFLEGEVCSGGSYTYREYRNKGLYKSVRSHNFHFLHKWGYKIDKFSIEDSGLIPQHVSESLGAKRTSIGKYLNILGFKSWKEIPA